MFNKELIEKGIVNNLVQFSEDNEYVTYVYQNKKRKYKDPEEQVQVETFLRLIIQFGYSEKRIKLFEPVKIGAKKTEADIIIFADDMLLSPYIVVECKKTEVSDSEFNEGINQAFSYAVSLNAQYVWGTSNIKNESYEVLRDKPLERTLNRIPQIPRFGQTEIQKFLYAKCGKDPLSILPPKDAIEQNFLELAKVPEDDLTKRFKQAHYALWGAGELKPDRAFDEFIKLIFCKYLDELKPRKCGEPYDFQTFKGENPEDLKTRVLAIYEEGRKRDPEVFKEDINLTGERIQTVVTYLQEVSLSLTDLDSKGRAFEAFTGAHFRGDFGQFFTPRSVVQFIVDTLPIESKHNVLDTSCGSGGFLLYVLDKIRKQADGYFDIERDAVKHHRYWHDFAAKNLFGIEISEDIARVAKMNMIIHDDGHTNVIAFDGLYQIDTIREKTKNQGFKESNFDFILTNPPFGSIVKQTEKSYMQSFGNTEYYYKLAQKNVDWKDQIIRGTHTAEGRETQATEVLFIEQCHKFLKPNGYLAIVIPDGILSNSSSQPVRNLIEELYRIVGVVSLPSTAFHHTGAGVKSSVMFLKKHTPSVSAEIKTQITTLERRKGEEFQLKKKYDDLQKEKKEHLKHLKNNQLGNFIDLPFEPMATEKEGAKKEINDYYSDRISLLKEDLEEAYQVEKRKLLKCYPIFMAIADDIGYDATGKKTGKNDLVPIGEELRKFIDAIEKGTDSFFR